MKTIFSLLLGPLMLSSPLVGKPSEDQEAPIKDKESPLKNPAHDGTHPLFQRLDRNGDGKIDAEEFRAHPRLREASPEQRDKLFERLDKNSDGLIQPSELPHPRERERGPRPPWAGKGPVNYETFAQGPRVARLPEEKRRELFNRLDRNGDGFLSQADLPTQRRPEPRPPGERRGGRRGGRRERLQGGGFPTFENADTNGDGELSFAEVSAIPPLSKLGEDEREDRFEALDKDGSGTLSSEEYRRQPRG